MDAVKLSAAQKDHLLRIVSYSAPGAEFPAGWMGTKSEKILEEKGLIHHWTDRRPLGGAGAIGRFMMTVELCEPTDDGWLEAQKILNIP